MNNLTEEKLNIDDTLTALFNDFELKKIKEEDFINACIDLFKDVKYIDKSNLIKIIDSVDDINKLKLIEKLGYLLNKNDVIEQIDTSTNNTPFDPDYNGAEIVDYKGFDQPWIGKTGRTINAINYKVRARD